MKSDGSRLLGKTNGNPLTWVLIVVIALCVIGMAGIAYVLVSDAQDDRLYQQRLAELRASSFQLTALSQDATEGSAEAFASLNRVVSRMNFIWRELESSDQQTRVILNPQTTAFGRVWNSSRDDANIILENQERVLFLHDVAETLNQEIPKLQSEYALIVEILLDNSAPANQVSNAQTQIWRAERIDRNVDKMLRGGVDADQAADQFNLDANLFGKILEGMEFGDAALGIPKITDREALESLVSVKDSFSVVSGQVRQIFEASPALFQSRQSASTIFDQSSQMLEALAALSDGVESLPGARNINSTLLLIVGGVGVVAFLILIFLFNQATNRRLKVTAETNDRNQNAILRLLDELADLADGDLTTTATVTEDFTGAIADSVNYTIDQLRILVSRINQTSERVLESSGDTQQTALHLAEAAEHQAQEIAGASAAINQMAVTIDQVSANAAESAGVAERSVSIANNGAKVVQNTIHGMDTIREQIQDTSKRIKRLGESSQEIGDIVGLINDIADQTNILALNAAIQASMAGDAGRGFAVVADEVQRLAERSATATKQIESLVKTIQTDTNEAVISMEQTTSEVVRGARLAQDAGVALGEIENVSANLAELIQNISNAARQQASSAGHISNTMNVIQEITSQTSAGTNATAESIGNLSDLALELNESVSDFTLPEDDLADGEELDQEDMISGADIPKLGGETELPSDYDLADESITEDATENVAEAMEEGADLAEEVADATEVITLDDEVPEVHDLEETLEDIASADDVEEFAVELVDADLEGTQPARSSDA